MLWAKESNKSNAPYIDILKNVTYPLSFFRMNREKNNVISENYRVEGNSKLSQSDYKGAMTSYNHSVSFAESKELLSLAIANRSLCFLKLNKFSDCLKDIQLARQNNYPEHLAPKLTKREQLCLEALQSVAKPTKLSPQLSFQNDENRLSMLNILEIGKENSYGRIVKANEDISIGQTVLIEKAYVRAVSGIEHRCAVCGRQEINFIPCASCADTLYCSDDCANNSFHKDECKLIFGHPNYCDCSSLSFILRSVLIGINTFSSFDRIKIFVEECLSTDRHEICEPAVTPESKYRTFFKLYALTNEQKVLDFRKRAFYIFNAIMGSQKFALKFQTISSQRFLTHLIIHHGLIISTNSFGGCCGEEMDDYQQNIFLMTSHINHSCVPNVIKLSKNDLAIVKTIQPIKKGQQIFLSYINDPSEMTGRDRNDRLEEIYGFRCKCELCINGFKLCGQLLENDEDFLYVAKNVDNCDNLLVQMKEHCISFLIKYLHLLPSEECLYVLGTLGAIFQKEISLC